MFELSAHAIEQAELRQIRHDQIFETLEKPDIIIDEGNGHVVYQKVENEGNGKSYL